MAVTIREEDIKHIAKLAKLSLSDSEIKKFENEIESIISYVSIIDECDTSDIRDEHFLSGRKLNPLREDVVKSGIDNKDILFKNASERNESGFIKTRRKTFIEE